MPSILGNSIWTYQLEDGSLEIKEADGVVAVSIQNVSSTEVNASITGDAVVAGLPSDAIVLTQNSSVTISSTNGKPIKSLTIDAPANCVLNIVANS